MKLEFKQKDFKFFSDDDLTHESNLSILSDAANKRLAEMLSSATVVYGQSNEKYEEAIWTKNLHKADDIRALLINIEPIVRKPCKHEVADLGVYASDGFKATCKHCGVELVAEWKVKS